MIIQNDQIRVIVEDYKNYTSEKIEVKDGSKWHPILSNLDGKSTLTFWLKDVLDSKKVSYERKKKKKLYYQLEDEDISLTLDYCLEKTNIGSS